MNNLFKKSTLLMLAFLVLMACKKEKNEIRENLSFEEITRDDIAAHGDKLTSEKTLTTDASGILWEAGTIVLYKTNDARYGKMEIQNMDELDNYLLVINAVTFNNDGSVFSQNASLSIRGTYRCDLDSMEEEGPQNDFFWERENDTDTYLSPLGNAVFYVY